jgi:hypothetical protein
MSTPALHLTSADRPASRQATSIAPAPASARSIPRCEQGAAIMTEPEASAPSAKANIVRWPPPFEETREAFETYVAAVGKVAYAWNYLHEQLGLLFAVVSGAKREVALAIWYSTKSDRAQREMLQAAADATNSERSKQLPRASDALKWLLDRANELAEARNDAVHAHVRSTSGETVSRWGPRFSVE